MPSISLAHVIQLLDRRRLVLQRQDQDLLLFFHSCTVRDNCVGVIEYWKCVHRICSIRLCSSGSSFKLLPEDGKHNHSSNDSIFSFLQKNQYRVEKIIFRKVMHSAEMSTCASSSQFVTESDCLSNKGAVLKQLLLSGKVEDVRRDSSKISCNPSISLLTSRMPSSGQSTLEQVYNYININQTPGMNLPTESSIQNDELHHLQRRPVANQMREATEQQTERWSPPVLSPPPLGGLYLPPSTPVARIEPYVEPQVMYNPFFLWQLYSYKQSCNNNYPNVLSLHPRTC